MKKIYMEKGKNYMIKKERVVKATEYEASGNIEIQDTLNKNNTFGNIQKISKYEYKVLDTDKIKRYKLGIHKNKNGVRRSMKKLNQILKNNFTGAKNELFVTLTTEKDVTDIREIKEKFQSLWKKLKKVHRDLEFVAVYEKNADKENWHIHAIFKAIKHKKLIIPNMLLEQIWGHGFTKISRISNKIGYNEINEQNRMEYKDTVTEKFGIDKVISYLCKTESKESIPTGERCYDTSKGIKRPKTDKVKYSDVRDKINNKYELKKEYTTLVRDNLTGAIINKVKTEIWKKTE